MLYAVALSSDLNYLASGHQDGGVRFWDVATAAKVSLVPKAHPQHVHSLQWHPRSDRTILVSSKEHPLKIIDTRTYEEVQVRTATLHEYMRLILTMIMIRFNA
jgi:WD40 repeat protein